MNFELIRFSLGQKLIIITPWEIFGYFGIALFSARWFVQLYYSHKEGRPVTPRIFWIFSAVGSIMTLTYYLFNQGDRLQVVGILGNLCPSFIAGYNLYLDLTYRRKQYQTVPAAKSDEPARRPKIEPERKPALAPLAEAVEAVAAND